MCAGLRPVPDVDLASAAATGTAYAWPPSKGGARGGTHCRPVGKPGHVPGQAVLPTHRNDVVRVRPALPVLHGDLPRTANAAGVWLCPCWLLSTMSSCRCVLQRPFRPWWLADRNEQYPNVRTVRYRRAQCDVQRHDRRFGTLGLGFKCLNSWRRLKLAGSSMCRCVPYLSGAPAVQHHILSSNRTGRRLHVKLSGIPPAVSQAVAGVRWSNGTGCRLSRCRCYRDLACPNVVLLLHTHLRWASRIARTRMSIPGRHGTTRRQRTAALQCVWIR